MVVPVHDFHRVLVDVILGAGAGKQYDWINKIMDCTAGLHPGREHRTDIVHSPAFISLLAPTDPVARLVAEIHAAVDPIMTNSQSVAALDAARAIAAIRSGRPDMVLSGKTRTKRYFRPRRRLTPGQVDRRPYRQRY